MSSVHRYGIDTILADEMCKQLVRDLGNNAVLSIQKKLLSKYSITLKQSVHEFEKLDDVLESIYGKACKKIERTCFENICTVCDFNLQKKNAKYLVFAGNSISENIFDIFSNNEKRYILEKFEEPNTIKHVLKRYNIKKTTGYKMINELIKDGFITKCDQGVAYNMHNAKFVSIFKEINILFNNMNEIEVRVKFEDRSFDTSVIPKIMMA